MAVSQVLWKARIHLLEMNPRKTYAVVLFSQNVPTEPWKEVGRTTPTYCTSGSDPVKFFETPRVYEHRLRLEVYEHNADGAGADKTRYISSAEMLLWDVKNADGRALTVPLLNLFAPGRFYGKVQVTIEPETFRLKEKPLSIAVQCDMITRAGFGANRSWNTVSSSIYFEISTKTTDIEWTVLHRSGQGQIAKRKGLGRGLIGGKVLIPVQTLEENNQSNVVNSSTRNFLKSSMRSFRAVDHQGVGFPMVEIDEAHVSPNAEDKHLRFDLFCRRRNGIVSLGAASFTLDSLRAMQPGDSVCLQTNSYMTGLMRLTKTETTKHPRFFSFFISYALSECGRYRGSSLGH